MLAVDIVGLVFTICLVGARYPHYVLIAATIHEIGRIMMTLFLHDNIGTVIAAGAFGTTVASNLKSNWHGILITFSGPLANYIVSATIGGIELETTRRLLNPLGPVRHPFAVVNLRLALLSVFVSTWLLFQ
ncbi:MAG: hypothetical protein H6Q73_1092 [Firmicutes bacterium]|nr:hypothetical protein [Bacillota bacterium]